VRKELNSINQLRDTRAVETIPVEKIRGPVLLVSGLEDVAVLRPRRHRVAPA
jgi:hypothetical protein